MDNASYYKSIEAPLYYRFILRNHSFCGVLLLRVADRSDFYITQIKAHGEYFEQRIPVVFALQR